MWYRTRCGGGIIITDDTRKHLRAHPEVEVLLPEACRLIELPKPNGRKLLDLRVEVDFGRVIGRTSKAETLPVRVDEPVWFAIRQSRHRGTRVLLDAVGPETSVLSVIARPAGRRNSRSRSSYYLITSYVGTLSPREPWDRAVQNRGLLLESLDFWTRHALIYDPDIMGEPFRATWIEVIGEYKLQRLMGM